MAAFADRRPDYFLWYNVQVCNKTHTLHQLFILWPSTFKYTMSNNIMQ